MVAKKQKKAATEKAASTGKPKPKKKTARGSNQPGWWRWDLYLPLTDLFELWACVLVAPL